MDPEAFKYIAIGFTIFGMIGAAIAISKIFVAMVDSISRNPGAEEKMSKYVYVGAGLAEAMGLFALVVALLLMFK
ncbi:ATP synthase subunit c [Candidatus Xenohaliotis californiensis]|uniref:ATP synthase subunit c n=1 Tax=Candidatus Xenohaliotis californiensis TaxID=84677 RepID=A0ABP0ERI3_9RICK|nr:ATP synthase subunit c [Candidatus Xenohaliotis californiensis]